MLHVQDFGFSYIATETSMQVIIQVTMYLPTPRAVFYNTRIIPNIDFKYFLDFK